MGKEMCKAFYLVGAHVVVASRKLDNCQELCAELEDTPDTDGQRTLAVACNQSSWDDCNALVATVYAEFGRCDVFVNNAGGSPLYPSLAEIDEAYFDKIVGLNMKGPFRLCALVGAKMQEQEWAPGETGSMSV